MDENLAGVGKVDRNPAADHGLNLADAPIRPGRMPYTMSRFDRGKGVHSGAIPGSGSSCAWQNFAPAAYWFADRRPCHDSFDEGGGWMVMDQASARQHVDQLQLADALCARLCHDLSSPLGTLINALDLAAEDPAFLPEALPLASESGLQMARQIRLLRAAWGGNCGRLDNKDLLTLAAGLPARVKVDISELGEGPFSEPVSRMLVNLMLLGVDGLPRGGLIRLFGTRDIILAVEGPGAGWPEALITAIAGPGNVSVTDPSTVMSPLAVLLASASGLRLSLLLAPGPMLDSVPPILLAPL